MASGDTHDAARDARLPSDLGAARLRYRDRSLDCSRTAGPARVAPHSGDPPAGIVRTALERFWTAPDRSGVVRHGLALVAREPGAIDVHDRRCDVPDQLLTALVASAGPSVVASEGEPLVTVAVHFQRRLDHRTPLRLSVHGEHGTLAVVQLFAYSERLAPSDRRCVHI